MSGNLEKILKCLEKLAPLRLAESWDNVGLLIEPLDNSKINKILLTNDLTQNVMKEAKLKNIEMIISYHPPIFRPLKRLRNNNWKESIILDCVRNNICLYSPHTALDSVTNGICDWILEKFNCEICLPIEKYESINESMSPGKGRYGKLKIPLSLNNISSELKLRFGLNSLTIALSNKHNMNSNIQTIGVCPGSGYSLLSKCHNFSESADLWITGEMSHHELLDARERGVTVILTCGHSNSERNFLRDVYQHWLKKELSGNIGDVVPDIIISSEDSDPLTII